MKNRRMFVLAVIGLALALVACSIGSTGSQETPTASSAAPAAPAAQTGGQATAAPAAQATSEATPASAQEAATSAPGGVEQDLTVSSVTEGLASLQSYKNTMTVQFSGTDDQGQPVNGTWQTEEDYTQEPQAQRVAITASGFSTDTLQNGSFEMITIGDTTYLLTQDQSGEPSCMSTSSSEQSNFQQGLFSPDILGGISDAKYVNTETVNGVKAKHYAWSEGNQILLGFSSSKGDVWKAVDGDYVVKYVAQASGKGALFGSTQEEGTITVDYELTDVNGSFTIEAPDSCAGPATDIPIMADAQDKSSFGEMLSYTSPSDFATVVDFYKTEMSNNGWQPSGEPMEVEGLASLEFTKDTRTAQVMITYDSDTQLTSVTVTTSSQ
jgi:hypothetical protein